MYVYVFMQHTYIYINFLFYIFFYIFLLKIYNVLISAVQQSDKWEKSMHVSN